MYPREELIRLAAHKAVLRAQIAQGRVRCVGAAARVLRPLVWMDKAAAFVRRFSPIVLCAAAPLALLSRRPLTPRFKLLGTLVRWAPLVFAAARPFLVKSPRG
jgi:hypothetical protein